MHLKQSGMEDVRLTPFIRTTVEEKQKPLRGSYV